MNIAHLLNLRVLRCAVITVIAGIAWPFVCGLLFLHIGSDVLMLQVQLLQRLGIHSAASLKAIIQISDALLWTVVFGVLFGLPLAVFVRKNVLRYWWLFFVSVLLLVAEGEVIEGGDIFTFISALALSQFPVYHAGILIVWFLTARVLSEAETSMMQNIPAS